MLFHLGATVSHWLDKPCFDVVQVPESISPEAKRLSDQHYFVQVWKARRKRHARLFLESIHNLGCDFQAGDGALLKWSTMLEPNVEELEFLEFECISRVYERARVVVNLAAHAGQGEGVTKCMVLLTRNFGRRSRTFDAALSMLVSRAVEEGGMAADHVVVDLVPNLAGKAEKR